MHWHLPECLSEDFGVGVRGGGGGGQVGQVRVSNSDQQWFISKQTLFSMDPEINSVQS